MSFLRYTLATLMLFTTIGAACAEPLAYGFGPKQSEGPFNDPSMTLIFKDGGVYFTSLYFVPEWDHKTVLKFPKAGGTKCYKMKEDTSTDLRIKYSKCVTLKYKSKDTLTVTLIDKSLVTAAPKGSVMTKGDEDFEEQTYTVRMNGGKCSAKLSARYAKSAYTGEDRKINDPGWGWGCLKL